jgi:hypothetical protein
MMPCRARAGHRRLPVLLRRIAGYMHEAEDRGRWIPAGADACTKQKIAPRTADLHVVATVPAPAEDRSTCALPWPLDPRFANSCRRFAPARVQHVSSTVATTREQHVYLQGGYISISSVLRLAPCIRGRNTWRALFTVHVIGAHRAGGEHGSAGGEHGSCTPPAGVRAYADRHVGVPFACISSSEYGVSSIQYPVCG